MKMYPAVPAARIRTARKIPITRWGVRLRANLHYVPNIGVLYKIQYVFVTLYWALQGSRSHRGKDFRRHVRL
jgi:hypothetical protein